MVMKLLSKSAIDQAKGNEQRQAIEEGRKLAERVDNLRELSAAEEVKFQEFRKAQLAVIHEEISQEAARRDALKAEVKDLEDRKREAKKPLTEEWEKVDEARSDLEQRGKELTVREGALSDRETAITQSEQQTASLLVSATSQKELASAALTEAQGKVAEAQKIHERASKYWHDAILAEEESKRLLSHREKDVSNREDAVTIREKEAAAKEKELTDGFRVLRDREKMLERNIKRTQ